MTDYNTEYFMRELQSTVEIESAAHELREAQEDHESLPESAAHKARLQEAKDRMDNALRRKPGDRE